MAYGHGPFNEAHRITPLMADVVADITAHVKRINDLRPDVVMSPENAERIKQWEGATQMNIHVSEYVPEDVVLILNDPGLPEDFKL